MSELFIGLGVCFLLYLLDLWAVIRLHKKIDMLGHVGALILTHLSRDYTSEEYPEEDIDEAIETWDNWDSA